MAQEQNKKGVDLDKLNQKFEKMLSEETPESFNEFVQKKVAQEQTRKDEGWEELVEVIDANTFGKANAKIIQDAVAAFRDKEVAQLKAQLEAARMILNEDEIALLNAQDALRQEVAQLREEIDFCKRRSKAATETIHELSYQATYWKERCEAAEKCIELGYADNNYTNWQRLKNQNQQ